MSRPKVSVIIPAYNQGEFLGDAIKSVLDQTFKDFELVIVNDASTDHTHEIVKQFSDRRIIYLVHETNKMLAAARNTGIRASSGEIITLLDADDIYHPQKLEKHIAFLDANPAIGVSYNPRFVLNHSCNTIRELVRPPLQVTLEDLVLGFPFAPSDMVIRRDWLFRVGLFDESFTSFSEDLDINCQLALAGCKFASVDRALNYRRYHSGRIFNNFSDRFDAALRALQKAFSDARCPENVLALQETAFMTKYLIWSFFAFSQGETSLGKRYILEAFRRDPSMLDGRPCRLMRSLLSYIILDQNIDHGALLRQILGRLPEKFSIINKQYDWAIAQGYLLKGISAIFWGRSEEGRNDFARALALKAEVDGLLIGSLSYQLLSYANEFGAKAASNIIAELAPYLTELGGHATFKKLRADYWFNLAFQDFRTGQRKYIVGDSIQAFVNGPKYLLNSGIWSILLRSILRQEVS